MGSDPQSGTDTGPWFASDDGRYIQSDDFTHDVTLEVRGDFVDDAERRRYAIELAARLTAACKPGVIRVA